jgi:HlyD family secretion protein
MPAPKKLILPILALAGAVGLGSWYYVTRLRDNDRTIRASGNIEVDDVAVSFKIPGRVVKRWVTEGEEVKCGEKIALLETDDLKAEEKQRKEEVLAANFALDELLQGSRPEEIEAARAALEKADAFLAELKHGSRPEELAASAAMRDAALAERTRLAMEWTRADQLYRHDKTIPKEQLDQATAAWKVAEERHRQADEQYKLVKAGPRTEQIDQAQAARNQAQWQYWLVVKGPREETIEQAKAKLQQAEAALESARIRLGYATIYAPLSGTVLSKNIEPGEYVAPGTPVVTMANLEQVWLRAYIDERDIGSGRVKWGQKVEVTTDTYPDKVYPGHIRFISSESEFTPKSVQTQKERVRLVYRIRIAIDNPEKELKPGMPADVRIGE